MAEVIGTIVISVARWIRSIV